MGGERERETEGERAVGGRFCDTLAEDDIIGEDTFCIQPDH